MCSSRSTDTVSLSPICSFFRTAVLSGNTNVEDALSGNTEVCHRVAPMVIVTGNDPHPRRIPRRSDPISSLTSCGMVTKCHPPFPGYTHTGAEKAYVTNIDTAFLYP